MKCLRITTAAAVTWLLGSPAALAQDLDLELTITLIGESAAELPESVTRQIELPEPASAEGARNSEEGLATANANRADAASNREEGLLRAEQSREREFGIAAEARERAGESGAEIAETARDNHGELVRGGLRPDLPIPEDLPELPVDVPERPGRPDLPDLPDVAGAGTAP